MLLMGLQAFNFVYSLPQLLRIVPCPRHRMPICVEEKAMSKSEGANEILKSLEDENGGAIQSLPLTPVRLWQTCEKENSMHSSPTKSPLSGLLASPSPPLPLLC